MEVSAKLRFARITPQKMRLVANLAKGLPVDKAGYQLKFSQKKGGLLLSKLLDSAVANAREKGGIDVDNLYVKNVFVDAGPIMKRFMPRAMGRATQILKRTSHVTLILDEAR
ncbi:MAG: 50S ribosomal protein L22 [Bdellovibrionaceae bacterium]|nr:50S ribosomal protein L22 [Bdellovibrionales bacterium]MCB9253966.1 50S ribosomal protein L22 [Pseudobdellovibrionaceae bacterium]